jgi:hypothetical protein
VNPAANGNRRGKLLFFLRLSPSVNDFTSQVIPVHYARVDPTRSDEARNLKERWQRWVGSVNVETGHKRRLLKSEGFKMYFTAWLYKDDSVW